MPKIQGLLRGNEADRRRRRFPGRVEITFRCLAAEENPLDELHIDLPVCRRSAIPGAEHKQMQGQDGFYLAPVRTGILTNPDLSKEVHSAQRSGFDFDAKNRMPRRQGNLDAVEIPFADAMENRDPGIQLAQIAVCEASKNCLLCYNLILVDHSLRTPFHTEAGQALRTEFQRF
ncbi:hypothetical protein [Mesorhizobium sp. ZC-5]|uniref:hypothetical protein n=1 Tax=Mesorhizobium sp. ZC-5 TaxID=2986066 RepID=UPI0029822D7C|nr:hypothetical protein [Mesorhizobium sp. ZC-5]